MTDVQRSADVEHETILAWFEALYGTAEHGWLSLFSVNRDTGERFVDWGHVDDLGALADIAAHRAGTCEVWFGVATRKERLSRGRGGDADCLELPGLWVDIDVDGEGHNADTEFPLPPDFAAAHLLATSFLPPTHVVNSGGGLQVWWTFQEMTPVELVAGAVLDDWRHTWKTTAESHGWHIDNVFDPARIMRLPGTVNRKLEGRPRPVFIVGDAQQ